MYIVKLTKKDTSVRITLDSGFIYIDNVNTETTITDEQYESIKPQLNFWADFIEVKKVEQTNLINTPIEELSSTGKETETKRTSFGRRK